VDGNEPEQMKCVASSFAHVPTITAVVLPQSTSVNMPLTTEEAVAACLLLGGHRHFTRFRSQQKHPPLTDDNCPLIDGYRPLIDAPPPLTVTASCRR
jgi:hypothetical protein